MPVRSSGVPIEPVADFRLPRSDPEMEVVAFGVASPFWPKMFESKGLTPQQIGLILAAALMMPLAAVDCRRIGGQRGTALRSMARKNSDVPRSAS
jgi:hypothetical protein